SDGTVWAWGYNLQGQLGRGTSTNYETTPIQVSDLTDVIAMAASGNSLALKSDGTVWAWGSNFNGAIGDGTTTHRYTPVQVRDLTGVTAIAAGQAHRLAVKASRATPTITWNNPADMVYDTPLGPAQLNAVATHQRERVDGTYTYDPPAGTVLRPGTGRELRVVFTPADTRKYTSATASARVNVRYVFGGFRQPVLAPVQTFRLGSTVPVKVQIFGANGAVPDAVVHLDVYKLNDDGSYDPAKDLVPDGSGDLFRYDAAEQQHIYNFGTREIASSGPGQYALVAELDDGTFHTVRVHLR
ncbi:MAG: PxKF domain-containing protein, partial [Chloroflexi bacterium]|nr:PxKF domain-containing protein [Chloroflexota bacterium]